MKRIVLVIGETGGGHRQSALALEEAARQRNLPWAIARYDVFSDAVISRIMTRAYNFVLRYGGGAIEGPLMVPVARLGSRPHRGRIKRLTRRWDEFDPDMVVSLVPFANRVLCQSLNAYDPSVPFVTVMTDRRDYPPCFWIERDQEQFLVCPSEESEAQALGAGHPSARVHRTSGLMVHPSFYRSPREDRAAHRQSLGLHPDVPTGIVMMGAMGSASLLTIAKALARHGSKQQWIFMCGKNVPLKNRMEAFTHTLRCHVQSYCDDVASLMGLADFLIGKPGPGALAEAFAMGLPAIVLGNASTLMQERCNLDWLRDEGLGIVVRHFRDIGREADALTRPEVLSRYREKVGSLNNRGVFETVEILDSLLKAGRATQRASTR